MPSRIFPPVQSYGGMIDYAEDYIYSRWGDRVSVKRKGKTLNRFGRTSNADAAVRTTVAQFQGSVVNETFVSTNIIDSIVSDAGSVARITVEGHTIDADGDLTFVTQTVQMNGTTEVALTTPLARATLAYVANSGTFNSPYSTPNGNIYIYDNTDGITAGVPNTAAATKLLIPAGFTVSSKCATTISSVDYWLITALSASIENGGNAAHVDFEIEIRDVKNGGLFRPIGVEISLDIGAQSTQHVDFCPFRVVPPNHDVRLIATATGASNVVVGGDLAGVLAIIV